MKMRYKNKTINSIYYNQTVVFVVVDLKDLHLETGVVVQATELLHLVLIVVRKVVY
jgi:hypothetical protein